MDKRPLPRRVAVKLLRRALALAARFEAGGVGVDHILRNPLWRKYRANERGKLIAEFRRLYDLLPVLIPRRDWPKLSRLIDRTCLFLK